MPNLGSPRAGLDYSDGTFYFRSADDNLLLGTGGRVHIDGYVFAGPNIAAYRKSNGSALAPHMFFRRFALEGGGLVRNHWFFWVGGNFAPTQVDANQATTSTAAVYDGFVGYQAAPHLQVYVGQNNTLITMENVTSSRWLDFMERSLLVRTVAAPYNKDLGVTLWGATKEGVAPFEFQAGVYGGDGMNRPNVDTSLEAMGRWVVRPLAAEKGALQRLHIGASGRYGSRDVRYVNYDAPTMSTPGGFAYWSPVYTLADKTGHSGPAQCRTFHPYQCHPGRCPARCNQLLGHQTYPFECGILPLLLPRYTHRRWRGGHEPSGGPWSQGHPSRPVGDPLARSVVPGRSRALTRWSRRESTGA